MNHNIITKCANSRCNSIYISDCGEFQEIYKKDLFPRGWIQYTEPSGDDSKKLAFYEFCSDFCKEQFLKDKKTWEDNARDSKLRSECICDRCGGLGYIQQEYENKKKRLKDNINY